MSGPPAFDIRMPDAVHGADAALDPGPRRRRLGRRQPPRAARLPLRPGDAADLRVPRRGRRRSGARAPARGPAAGAGRRRGHVELRLGRRRALVRGGHRGLRARARPLQARGRDPERAPRAGGASTASCSPSRAARPRCSRPGCRRAGTSRRRTSASTPGRRRAPSPAARTRGRRASGRCPAGATSRGRTRSRSRSARGSPGWSAFFNEHVDLTVDGEPQRRPFTPWSLDSRG